MKRKKDIIKALEKLKETAKKHYHKTTKIIIGPYTGEDAQKGDKSMRIANDLLPDVSLPIMKQTQNWYPYKINTGQYGIKTVIMNINEPKNVINNEADLLDAWYYDNVQYFGSNSIGDRLFRFMTGIKARIKGKRLGINKETVNQIIKNGNEKCKKTELNRLEEQKFLKSLKI